MPIIYIRELSNIGYFSAIILIFSISSIIIIILLSTSIINMSPQQASEQYHINLTSNDRDFKYCDWLMIPIFISTFMNVFEGNQQILNLYSESEKPRAFFLVTSSVIVTISFMLALFVGYLGYFAFGNSSKSVILYNLPNEDPASITAQIFYILTITGSYVLLIQPVFYVMENSVWYRFGQEDQVDQSLSQHSEHSVYLNNHDAPFKWWMYIRHFTFRTLTVALICISAFLIPNLNVLLTLVGAILGTIISVIIPVAFYNRAYDYSEKSKHFG